jgi:ribonuclease Z
LHILFLGTGGYHPNERRHTACVMLPEIGVIFDAGTSFFRVPDRLETKEVQIFLSHAHIDHTMGLTFFLGPMANGDVMRVCLHGTEKTLNAIQEHLFSEPLFPVKPGYEYIPLASEIEVPGNGIVRHVPLKHPGGSTGYRIDFPDRSMAYITDTSVDDTYTDFIRGVDLLIHECNFPDEVAEWSQKVGHSHATQVAKLAQKAEVKRLLLVHIDPQRTDDDPIGLATAQAIFANTEIAEDGMSVEF